jgi:hypothetical protein
VLRQGPHFAVLKRMKKSDGDAGMSSCQVGQEAAIKYRPAFTPAVTPFDRTKKTAFFG